MAINVKGIKFESLTDEQKAQMAAILGVDVSAISAPAPAKVNMGKLDGKIGEDGTYVCPCCGKTENYNDLDDTAKAKARKTGLCTACQKIADFIGTNKSAKVRVKNEVSNGELCRAAILPHIDQLTAEHMALLTDKEFCKKQLKLAYALFVKLPENCSKAEKDAIRKPNGKDVRFAAIEYTILGDKYVMCNDLYLRNVAPIESYFAQLFPADAE